MKNNILFYGNCQSSNLYIDDLYGRSFLRESLKDFNVPNKDNGNSLLFLEVVYL